MPMEKAAPTVRSISGITFDHLVVVPTKLSYNHEYMEKVHVNLFHEKFGCPACHSGKATLFTDELRLLEDMRRTFAQDFIVTKAGQLRPLADAISLT